MTELERALVALGQELDFPPEPDLVAAVRARLGERRRLAFLPPRRALAFAVALIVVAFGIAMAVPQARSAILRFFHIGAVTVERVEALLRAARADRDPAPLSRRARPARRDAGRPGHALQEVRRAGNRRPARPDRPLRPLARGRKARTDVVVWPRRAAPDPDPPGGKRPDLAGRQHDLPARRRLDQGANAGARPRYHPVRGDPFPPFIRRRKTRL